MYANASRLSIDPAAFELPPLGARIHLVAACGTGMGALAAVLVEGGWRVTGSDLRAAPPMGPLLRELGVELRLGYDPGHLELAAAPPALVVVGNAVGLDNVELQAALDAGVPVTHMPAIAGRLWAERRRIVVAGTHGKSTTTATVAWLLERAGLAPGWLVGALPRFGPPGRLGRGPVVLEGDEYGSAPFDRRAKFLHYRPELLAITGVEFDHADRYWDLEEIRDAFRALVAGLPAGGVLVTPERWSWLRPALPAGVTWRVLAERGFRYAGSDAAGARFHLGGGTFRYPLPGRHGAVDAALALELVTAAGIAAVTVASALAAYPGLALRQEHLLVGPVTLVRDFGHHPTEVAVTLAGLRERYPEAALWAVFEPRSYTSRTDRFRERYVEALAAADRVFLAPVHRPEALREPPLDTAALAVALGRGARAFESWPELTEALREAVAGGPRPLVVVCFSNGTMEGVPERLAEEWRDAT